MLNVIEIVDLKKYVTQMESGREKELFHTLLFEYEEYIQCGTPEECQQRIEWMTMSIEDIRKAYVNFVKGAREYMAEEIENACKKKKRGRPPKAQRAGSNG